ncbi:YcxB family protein [Inquilinus sp. CA228]|uniref:YcxB family protein n=1 Tax=Inquilinus sp. CA228 TaxID=3455609 RepID=UPI003F8CF82D
MRDWDLETALAPPLPPSICEICSGNHLPGWPILNMPISSSAETRIALTYRLDRSDYIEFSLFCLSRTEVKIRGRKKFARSFVIWLLVGLALFAVMSDSVVGPVPRSTILYISFGIFLICVPYLVFRKHFQRRSIQRTIGSDPGATFEGQVDLVLDDQGVDCRSDGSHSLMEWRAFRRVEETPTHIFLLISDLQALIIPKRDLSVELASEIVRFSAERMALSGG